MRVIEIDIPEPSRGQVLVDLHYSGICHTQILEARGRRGQDPYLPHCMGHEGSGIVHKVGPDVTTVEPGDRVILSWLEGTGHNVPSVEYNHGGRTINAGAITTFNTQALISENRITPVSDNLDFKEAALVGCAAATGLGTVFNTLNPESDSSIVIFGVGGIGLFSVLAAIQSNCAPVVCVDIVESKLELAKKMGATHTINGTNSNVESELNRIRPDGFDYALEASGQTSVMNQALNSVKHQGGEVAVVGNAPTGETLSLDPRELNMGKSLLGTWGGDTAPDRDFPKYVDLFQRNRDKIALYTQDIYPLENINEALTDLENGNVLRPLISLNPN